MNPVATQQRFLVYRSRFYGKTKRRRPFLFVAMARDAAHALTIGRRLFHLEKDAYAIPEKAPSPLFGPLPTALEEASP